MHYLCMASVLHIYQHSNDSICVGNETDGSHLLPPEIDSQSKIYSQMSIRKRYLPYTKLKFTLNSTMVGEPYIESIRMSKFKIVKSPLRGSIVGGPYIKVPWKM